MPLYLPPADRVIVLFFIVTQSSYVSFFVLIFDVRQFRPTRAKEKKNANMLLFSRPLSGSAGSQARRASRLRAGIGNLNRRPAARFPLVPVPAVGPSGNIGRLLLVP